MGHRGTSPATSIRPDGAGGFTVTDGPFVETKEFRRAIPLLVLDEVAPDPESNPDDRLRLMCACCHPALPEPARVALMLRLICGLTTAEVAKAFLVSEPRIAARITRAKKKISAAGIP